MTKDRILEAVARSKGIFTHPPEAVPAGNVDVSGGGRWRIWQDAGTRIDAPVMGNGDLLSAFAGPVRYPQWWFTTNDFWQLESAANWEFFTDNEHAKFSPAMSMGSPKPVGRIVFDIPALEGCDYRAEQTYLSAETVCTYSRNGSEILRIAMWVAAVENELVLEFTAGETMDTAFEFRFPDETGMGCDIGVDIEGQGDDDTIRNDQFIGMLGGRALEVKRYRKNCVEGWREFSDHVDRPVKAGFCGGFIGGEPEFTNVSSCGIKLTPGETRTFVLSVRSMDKVSRPYEYARSRTHWITQGDVEQLRAQHKAWWRSYWSVSGVIPGDALLEQRYYLSQYMMGSLSRDPDFPPNILGISTFDRQAWNGNYKINYNHQTPYLALLTSGHFEQADPHDAPYLAMTDIAGEMSRRLLGHEGLYYPLGLGPAGMVSESLLLGMKSPAVHGALNMIMRWELTRDTAYARRVYPFLRRVAEFWEKDIVVRDGAYHVYGDGMHERTARDIEQHGTPEDPVNTLGYLHTFFTALPQIANVVGVDADMQGRWLDIAGHLAPYPKGTIRNITDNPTLWKEADADLRDLLPEDMLDKPVFYDEAVGGKWSYHFPGNVMHIYPGNAVGHESAPEERAAAYNTVHIHALIEDALAARADPPSQDRHFDKAGAWNASNLSCLFFPAAVRVGYDPDVILRELKDMIIHRGIANGYLKGNPHGIENLSTVPNTLQEMMLQSYEHVIRVFPNWPRGTHPDACFFGLWAYGAFRISSEMKKGAVVSVRIESLKGTPCRIENPWPGQTAHIADELAGRCFESADSIIDLPTHIGAFSLNISDAAEKSI